MLRAGLAALLVALASTAPAQAWVERPPPLDLPHGAACLRAAGPGQLAVLGELTTRTSATDLLAVGDTAIERRDTVTLGWLIDCAEAGGATDTAPLLAGPVVSRTEPRSSLGLRAAAPGGPVLSLREGRRTSVGNVAVAVAGGAAVVAWVESASGGNAANRLLAVVRRPGATRFGRVRFVARGVSDWDTAPVVAVDPAGRAHVAWIGPGDPESPRDLEDGSMPDEVVRVATAAPGQAFGPPQDLGRTWGSHVALAAASDGGALVVAPLRGPTGAWERRPGQRRFVRIPLPSIAADEPAVALAANGGAVLAYRNSGGVDVLRRQPGRAFGKGQEVFPSEEGATSQGWWSSSSQLSGPIRPPDSFAGNVAVRLAADGSIAVAWVDPADEQGTTEPPSAHAAFGTLAGGFPQPAARLGSACRSANATTPFELVDGSLAVAWSDNAAVSLVAGEEAIAGGGQVHVARPDAAATPAPPAPPGLTAELVERRARVGAPMRVRVRCADGPCDVRAVATAQRIGETLGLYVAGEPAQVARSMTLAAGTVSELVLDPPGGYAFARAGTTAPVRVALTACAPSGAIAQQMTLEQPLTVAPTGPLPRIARLRARRLPGGAVRVTWRSARPAGRGATFAVLDAEPSGDGPVASTSVPGRGRSRFSVTLRPRDKPIRRVLVVLATESSDTADVARARVT